MIDQQRPRIKLLDDKSSNALLHLQVESAVNMKGLTAAFASKEVPTGVERTKFEEQFLQVSGIIVSALGDHALRVVRSVVGNPTEMLEKLDARYGSKLTASRITKTVNLVSIRYTNPWTDCTTQIDRMAAIAEQLKAM